MENPLTDTAVKPDTNLLEYKVYYRLWYTVGKPLQRILQNKTSKTVIIQYLRIYKIKPLYKGVNISRDNISYNEGDVWTPTI